MEADIEKLLREINIPIVDPLTSVKLKLADFNLFTQRYYTKGSNNAYFTQFGAQWNSARYDDICAAPSVAEAIEWLRQVKKLHVDPKIMMQDGKLVYWVFIVHQKGDNLQILDKHDVFVDRNQGLSWGLNEALEWLLKTKKL